MQKDLEERKICEEREIYAKKLYCKENMHKEV